MPIDDTTPNHSTLYNYPTLGRLFESAEASERLSEMRTQLGITKSKLERVIRQGSHEDARRASIILRAYLTTLALFNELERVRGAS